MKIYKFTAIFTPEKGTKDVYNVSVPALPGCLTFGESLVEAKYNIRDAMELYLENMLDDGETIPKDKKTRAPKNALTEEVVVGVDYEVKTGFDNFKTELQYA